MTIETKNTLQPGAYGFNSKAGDYEIVAFYWVEGAQVFVTSEHRKKKTAPERAFFAVGKAPKIELINLRDLSVGTLETLKKMPGYKKAIKELTEELTKEKEKDVE